MKLVFLACFLGFGSTLARADWTLSPLASTQKLTASAPGKLDPFTPAPVELRAVKGEWESFQFVVGADETPIQKLEIIGNGMASAGGDFLPSSAFSFFRENFALVEKPSGNAVLTPKWWPDALVPWNLASRKIEAGQSAVFWATVKIPPTLPSGDYFGELDVLADGAPRRLALTLRVENKLLPPPRFRGMVALYYDTLRDWYSQRGQSFSDADWEKQKRRFYDFLLDYRLNAYDLPVSWHSENAAKILSDARVVGVRLPPLDNPDFPAARAKLAAIGTRDKAFYYWHDEPQTSADYAKIREVSQQLRALGLKHLVTAHPNKSLENAVDIWCPNVGDWFGPGVLDFQKLVSEREKGREIWSYTMAQPRFPFPTWLLDDDGEAIRSYANFWREHEINGFVYSMCHGWGPKPLENLISFAETNGDGTLLYPAELVGGVGPMPSIRLMLLRDAIEDWELNRPFETQRAWPNVLPAPRKIALGKAEIDGALSEWKPGDEQPFFKDSRADFPLTRWFLRREGETLYAGFRVQNPREGDWAALEIWASDGSEKWRFVGTEGGKIKVEKWTREGRFEIEMPGSKSEIKPFHDFFNVEFAVPSEELPRDFRVGALRRTLVGEAKTRVILNSEF